MPRRHFYRAFNGANGALPSRFALGYQFHQGTYLELDLNSSEATNRQEIFHFVQRVYQTQLGQYSLFYIDSNGSNFVIPCGTVVGSFNYVMQRFRGQSTMNLYIWDRPDASLHKFKLQEQLKREVMYKDEPSSI
ncbi:hypothetical protein TCAL_16090 [Tigriopus californicus]|uniref:Uncharacterized protein n=2 Tax=Tigriopus californicus TaxID=6832 RepID=A0A553PQ09_TIGCA|nr:hypothetical protein TCAL_16090 [Tigriopus californicus]